MSANVITALSAGYQGDELPSPPTDEEKHSYAWRSLPYLTVGLVISSMFVVLAQLLFEIRNPVVIIPFGFYTLAYAVYQLIAIPVNFTGKSFDMRQHELKVRQWHPDHYPDVDLFLPVCGEPLAVLRNTWEGVQELLEAYPGYVWPWVLDDGWSDEVREMAREFDFGYIRRAERSYKKAGNLRTAFFRTRAPFIIILDADFRPRPDFLAETLPYMDNPGVGIVQTPQFFRVLKSQTWVERAAAASLEVFYRSVQQSRDRFGSALCVGSCALYRRTALEPSKGCFLIPYAEDSHTGLDARKHGFELKYLPIPLSTGICPPNVDAFMRQQYRWCNGATSLIWHGHMWRVPMPFVSRLPYVAGWLWNFTTALRTLLLPLIPIVLLAFFPGEIRLRNVLLLVPAIIVGTVLYPLWHHARWTLATWPLALAVGWAQILGIWDFARGKVMGWDSTIGTVRAPARFRKCVIGWNGTLALLWAGLAAWRIAETGSDRFAFVLLFGIINLVVVGRIAFPGKVR